MNFFCFFFVRRHNTCKFTSFFVTFHFDYFCNFKISFATNIQNVRRKEGCSCLSNMRSYLNVNFSSYLYTKKKFFKDFQAFTVLAYVFFYFNCYFVLYIFINETIPSLFSDCNCFICI